MFLFAENDEGQQPGASLGRLRDDGQRHCHLLGQDGHADDEPHDRRELVHLREAEQDGAELLGHTDPRGQPIDTRDVD